jgi:hypothetical protein
MRKLWGVGCVQEWDNRKSATEDADESEVYARDYGGEVV